METVFIVIAAAIVIACLAKTFWREKRAEMIDKIPGPTSLPFVGNLFEVAVRRDEVVKGLMKRTQDYGTIYRIWMGPIPIVHISKPKYIEIILNTSKHTKKGNFYKFLYPWLGTGLLTSSGHKWFHHRKLITPTFHFKILEEFLDVFAENSEILVDKLNKVATTGENFDVFPLVTLCALDIICETAMGIRLNAQSDEKSVYVASLKKISELTTERSNKLWLHPDVIFYNTKKEQEYKKHLTILHDFTRKVIKERKEKTRKNLSEKEKVQDEDVPGTKKRKAFLDLTLEASGKDENQKMSEKDIREEVDTFVFEGHDTTTAGICWVLHSLGHHPEIQEEVWREQEEVFGSDALRAPTMRDLGEMKLLERVIKESLRLYPSVSFISRKLDEEVTLGHKFALVEEKTVLSYLVRSFRIKSLEHGKKLTLTNELILRPLEGIQLRITKR